MVPLIQTSSNSCGHAKEPNTDFHVHRLQVVVRFHQHHHASPNETSCTVKQLGPGLVAKSTTTQRNFQRFNAQVRGHQPTTLAAGSALKTKTSSNCPGRDGIICNQKLVSNLCQCTMNTDLRSNGHTPAPTLQPKICPGKTKPNREP